MNKSLRAVCENHAEEMYDAIFIMASANYACNNPIYAKMGAKYLTFLAKLREEARTVDLSVE